MKCALQPTTKGLDPRGEDYLAQGSLTLYCPVFAPVTLKLHMNNVQSRSFLLVGLHGLPHLLGMSENGKYSEFMDMLRGNIM